MGHCLERGLRGRLVGLGTWDQLEGTEALGRAEKGLIQKLQRGDWRSLEHLGAVNMTIS